MMASEERSRHWRLGVVHPGQASNPRCATKNVTKKKKLWKAGEDAQVVESLIDYTTMELLTSDAEPATRVKWQSVTNANIGRSFGLDQGIPSPGAQVGLKHDG